MALLRTPAPPRAPGYVTAQPNYPADTHVICPLSFHGTYYVLATRRTWVSMRDGDGSRRSTINVVVQQDATGNRQVDYSPFTIFWKGGAAPPSTQAANRITHVRFTWLGSWGWWFGEFEANIV